jgi:hypothetical protein
MVQVSWVWYNFRSSSSGVSARAGANIMHIGIKTTFSSIIIFKRPNYERGILLISSDAIEGHFEGNTPREIQQGNLVVAQCPGSPGTLQPTRNWPTWVSNALITYPILRIWPRRTTTYSLY